MHPRLHFPTGSFPGGSAAAGLPLALRFGILAQKAISVHSSPIQGTSLSETYSPTERWRRRDVMKRRILLAVAGGAAAVLSASPALARGGHHGGGHHSSGHGGDRHSSHDGRYGGYAYGPSAGYYSTNYRYGSGYYSGYDDPYYSPAYYGRSYYQRDYHGAYPVYTGDRHHRGRRHRSHQR